MSEYISNSNDFHVEFLSSNMESSHCSPSQQVPQLKDISTKPLCKDITLDPYLQIVEQPQDRFRFRYISELNIPHGFIFGQTYLSTNVKIHPMVQLLNYEGKATIRCGLAQIDNENDHPHQIAEGRQYERISAIVPQQGSYLVAFPGITIIHTPRRDVENELAEAYCRDNIENVTPAIRRQSKIDAKRINLNIVRLKFSAHDVNTGTEICPPVFSQAIKNLKSAATNRLRICRMSRMYGSPRGGDDVFIFVEKVSRNDIQVRFFELSENGKEVWSANGRFLQCDVHYQYGIVFSTPPYRDTNITSDVKVHIQLVRPSDDSVSNSMDFTYKGTPYALNRKRSTYSRYSWYEEYRTEYRYLDELPGDQTKPSSSDAASTSTSSLQFSQCNFNRMQMEYEVYCKRNALVPFNFTRHEEQHMETKPTEQTSQTLETVFSPLVMDKMMQTVLKLFIDLKYLKKPIEVDDTQFKKIRGTLEGIFETTLTNGEKFLHMMMAEDLPSFFKHTVKLINSVNLSYLLNLRNDRGQTILHLTIINNLVVVPFLIHEGCDPMVEDFLGNNTLHYAIMYKGALKILFKAIKHFKVQIDLNAYNEDKQTPLHLAVLRGLLCATYSLLEEGACVNMPDANGRTPLHLAVCIDSPLLVAAILRYTKPADPMKKVHNQTAWTMASKPIRNFIHKYKEKIGSSEEEDTSDEKTSSEESVDLSCKQTSLRDDCLLMSCDH